MQEQLISYETAIMAKEKGFNIPCTTTYNDKNTILFWYPPECFYGYRELKETLNSRPAALQELPAPTQSLLQKWLREEKKIHIYIKPMSLIGFVQYYNIEICLEGKPWDEPKKVTGGVYEEALEAGLQEALKLI